MALRANDQLLVTSVKVIPETLRIGRSMGFSRSLIADAPERVIRMAFTLKEWIGNERSPRSLQTSRRISCIFVTALG